MMAFESFGGTNKNESLSVEALAEKELAEILENPENSFLNEIEANSNFIDDANSAEEALEFAKKKIRERLEKSTVFHTVKTIEGIEMKEVDVFALKRTMDTILENKFEIGRGGDAFVVIDKSEVRELPPEVCYKFSLAEATPRGRNSVDVEAELQGSFYDAIHEFTESKIGVPIPFYVLESGHNKMIAMEKLKAKSIDDILRGDGYLPSWLDVDIFCEELISSLKYFHGRGLYHRDMHFGNIMISQSPEEDFQGKWGYLIDFGLSGHEDEEQFAYEKEQAGNTFTYADDYAIINEVRKRLSELKYREL